MLRSLPHERAILTINIPISKYFHNFHVSLLTDEQEKQFLDNVTLEIKKYVYYIVFYIYQSFQHFPSALFDT